jgi:hypothetical protein
MVQNQLLKKKEIEHLRHLIGMQPDEKDNLKTYRSIVVSSMLDEPRRV